MVLTLRVLWPAAALGVVVVIFPGLFGWCLLALLGLVLADILLAGSARKVEVERIPGSPVRSGEPTTARTRLRNLGTRSVRGTARDGWQPTAGAQEPVHPLRLAPAGSAGGPASAAEIGTALAPQRRGDLRSEHMTIRSVGPLGIAGRQAVHRQPHSLRVLPPFRSRKHLPSKRQRLREIEGATAVNQPGAGTEFDSLRDYVRGDDVRSIDWRATARRQSTPAHQAGGTGLVVRTWRPERDRQVVLCLDASRTSAARIGDEPRLDTGIEAALLLGVLASSAGDRVDLLAFHRKVIARASSRQKGDFLAVEAAALAQVVPVLTEADFSQLPGQVSGVSAHRSLVVILSALDSASLQEGLLPVLPALTAKHTVVIASVRDPEVQRSAAARDTVSEVFAAAAAERAGLEAEALKAELAAQGVEIVEAGPEELPPALADKYIQLKAAGKL